MISQARGSRDFKAAPGHENIPLTQGETVQARFFVFDRQPAMDRLVPPNPETPVASRSRLKTVGRNGGAGFTGTRWAAHQRPRNAVWRRPRCAMPPIRQKPSADGLADLLWSVMMTPEFQLVR